MRAKVEAALRDYVAPMLEADGGRVELIEIEDNTIVLRFSGQCAGCPGQPFTLIGLIEPVLKRVLGAEIQVQTRA